MSFEHPLRLFLAAVVVALLALVYRALAARRTGSELAYSNLAFFSVSMARARRPDRWLFVAWVVALALLGVAFAGLRLRAWVPAHGTAIVCIDTSGSMASTDVTPTRAKAAAAAARAFANAVPEGTRIGVVTFATSAEVLQPPTTDRTAVQESLAQIPPTNGATAIGDALQLARSQLPPGGARAVILITDGVSNSGSDPLAAAQALGAHHIPVYTVGIGTNSGATIPGTNEIAGIDEGALQAYAQVSGGTYARADDANQLRQALARLGRTTTYVKKLVDASFPAAIIGAALMTATFLAGLALGRFP